MTMTLEQWQRVREVYETVVGKEPDGRETALAEICANDEHLRREVEELLVAREGAATFLEIPPFVNPNCFQFATFPDNAIGRRIGPYRIVREIGQGGMSTVYLATRADDEYKKEVAIKLVWPGLKSAEVMSRFKQERQILANLDHPNIARLLDGGTTDDGWPYLVMEYVDGVPITQYCTTNKLLTTDRLKLFRTVCTTVQYAHRNLIIHRDLKPSNILVTIDGTIKLLDFGIAKLLNPPAGGEQMFLTQSRLNWLTPEYASPEQLRGGSVTTASDVYSLGVVLYELLTSERPCRVKDLLPHEVVRVICEQEPERPSARIAQLAGSSHQLAESDAEKMRRRLQGDLDNIVLKALQKDEPLRYQTVEQLSADLDNHSTGQPVTARPATLRYRTEKYVKRNKAFVLGTVALLLVLIAGAGLILWQLRISREREREQSRQLYAADMRQAGQDWAEGNLVQMGDLLEAHRPGTRSDAWRGFEWAALWNLLHTEKFTLPDHDWVPAVRFTPDGKTVLTGTRDGRIEMWDVQNGRSLGAYTMAHPEGVFTLLFTNDGKRLVTNGFYGLVRIWDFAARRVVRDLRGTTGERGWPILSPDGRRLAVYWSLQDFKLFDTETGDFIQDLTLPTNAPYELNVPIVYMPDGRLTCLARRERRWELWDVFARRLIIRLDPQSDDPQALRATYAFGLVFSPDGRRLYLPTQDHLLRVWDLRSGKLLHVFSGHRELIEPPALSHDGRFLATGSDDRTLRLWDTETGKLLAVVVNESQTFYPVFSPDDKSLAAVCQRALRAKVWDVQKLLTTPPTFEKFYAVALSPNGKTMLTASTEGTTLRDVQTGQKIIAYDAVSNSNCVVLNCMAFSNDGKLVALIESAVQPETEVVEVRDVATGENLANIRGHKGLISTFGFSPDGRTLATGGRNDRLIKLWDSATWRERAVISGHTDIITGVVFSPDSRKLASSSYDDNIKIWETASGRELLSLRGHHAWVQQVQFSPDGKTIASASWDYTVKLWDATTGRELRTLKGHANSIYCLAFSPDGQRLATGGDDQTVRLWDSQTGTELTALRGHTDKVRKVFFTTDGKTLVSASLKETRLWRTGTDEKSHASN